MWVSHIEEQEIQVWREHTDVNKPHGAHPGVTAPGHALYGDQGDSILLATTLQTCLLPFYTLDSCSLSFAPPNIFGRHASWEPKGKPKALKSISFCSMKFRFILLHMKLMKESKGSNPGSE